MLFLKFHNAFIHPFFTVHIDDLGVPWGWFWGGPCRYAYHGIQDVERLAESDLPSAFATVSSDAAWRPNSSTESIMLDRPFGVVLLKYDIYNIYTSIHLIFPKKKHFAWSLQDISQLFEELRPLQAKSRWRMVLPIHRLRQLGWEGKMSVAATCWFFMSKKVFRLFGQFLSNLHLFGVVFSTFYYWVLFWEKPSRPKIFPLQKLSALLMFLFLPSCWMWVCKLNQPEYQFDVHYVLFNLFKHVLHYPFWSGPGPSHVLFILTWGKMTCLKHVNTINLGVFWGLIHKRSDYTDQAQEKDALYQAVQQSSHILSVWELNKKALSCGDSPPHDSHRLILMDGEGI